MVWQYRKKNHFKFLRSNSLSPRLPQFLDKMLNAFGRRAIERVIERDDRFLFDDDDIECMVNAECD